MQTVHGIYDGQAIRPTEAVEARPNTKVLITFLDEEPQPSPFEATQLADVAGCLAYSGPVKTLDDMQAAVRRRAKEQWR